MNHPSTTIKHNQPLYGLLEDHRKDVLRDLDRFTEVMAEYRIHRRNWEFSLVKWLYARHPDRLVNQLTDDDIAVADQFCAAQNESKPLSPWFMRRLDEALQILPQQKVRDLPVCVWVPKRLDKIEKALPKIQRELALAKRAEAEAATRMDISDDEDDDDEPQVPLANSPSRIVHGPRLLDYF